MSKSYGVIVLLLNMPTLNYATGIFRSLAFVPTLLLCSTNENRRRWSILKKYEKADYCVEQRIWGKYVNDPRLKV